jgi:hypothetical protein
MAGPSFFVTATTMYKNRSERHRFVTDFRIQENNPRFIVFFGRPAASDAFLIFKEITPCCP